MTVKMVYENLQHFEPTDCQWKKFRRINQMTNEDWELACVKCNDCSICQMAVHQQLYTTSRHNCVYGITDEQFRALLDNADCDF